MFHALFCFLVERGFFLRTERMNNDDDGALALFREERSFFFVLHFLFAIYLLEFCL